jgi:hypothetical protein
MVSSMATGKNAVDSTPMQPFRPKKVEDRNSEAAETSYPPT